MVKRGSGHLEMIMAFTIFLVCVVFLLVYLKPLETDTLSEVAIISLKEEFMELASTELTLIFVNGSERCLPISNISDYLLELNSTYQNVSFSDSTYYLLFSKEFSTKLNPCSSSVTLGSISHKNILSNKSLQRIQEKYYSNYSGLKEDLKVPKVLNFEILGPINLSRGSNEEIEVIAKSYTLGILNEEGKQLNEEFVFKIW